MVKAKRGKLYPYKLLKRIIQILFIDFTYVLD